MKSLIDFVKGRVDEGAGAPGGSDTPRAKGLTDPAVGHIRRVSGKGLWQGVGFVPKIVEKVGR